MFSYRLTMKCTSQLRRMCKNRLDISRLSLKYLQIFSLYLVILVQKFVQRHWRTFTQAARAPVRPMFFDRLTMKWKSQLRWVCKYPHEIYRFSLKYLQILFLLLSNFCANNGSKALMTVNQSCSGYPLNEVDAFRPIVHDNNESTYPINNFSRYVLSMRNISHAYRSQRALKVSETAVFLNINQNLSKRYICLRQERTKCFTAKARIQNCRRTIGEC